MAKQRTRAQIKKRILKKHNRKVLAKRGPSAMSDRKALQARRQKHILDRDLFGRMLEAIDVWVGPQGQTSANFLKFIARVPVRASELAGATWAEFRDLDDPTKALWVVPGARMKQREEHVVPLPRQAVAILIEQRAEVAARYPTGSDYVFPSRDTGRQHIDGDNQKRTLNALGYGDRHSVHGFRHSFTTMAAEAGQDVRIAHRCTGHQERDPVLRRYDMSKQIEQRRAMLVWWADQIESMKNGYKVPT